jgi:hypothetical protein
MDIIDIIAGAQGGRGLENLGQQFGLSPTQTRAAVEALAPVVAAGISRNASSGGGLADLLGAVLGGNHGRYLDDPNATQYDAAVDDGNAILGHVFGSKDVSRGVAMKAGEFSGVGGAILKKMLPVIATMVMGALAKRMFGGGNAQAQTPGGGGLGDILGDILGGGQRGGAASGGSGGGLGDILGDILGGGRSQPQAQPVPQRVPQGGGQAPGSLEDILKDILGGNGKVVVYPPGQGVPPGMEDILRDIFGGGAGGGSGRIPPQAQEEAARRGREAIDDMLGRRATTRRTGGSAADDLLNSVEESLRRR